MKNTKWFKDAIIYQIYPISFMDSNNDGLGDIKGIISNLEIIPFISPKPSLLLSLKLIGYI